MKNLLVFIYEAWKDMTLIILTVAALTSILLSFYQPSEAELESEPGQLLTSPTCIVMRQFQLSVNQSNQIYTAPYVASESEARVGGARLSVHIHCKQCQTVLSLKVA